MGSQSNTLHSSTVARSQKQKLENQHADLADHNYSANIQSNDFLNGSNSSSLLSMLKILLSYI